MAPDYGLELLRSNIRQDVALNFYQVPFRTIAFIAPNSYSTMMEHEHLGQKFAVSFDFDDDVLAFLVAKVPANLRAEFGKSIVGKKFPFSANLPMHVEADTLECRLGSVQHGVHDSFVPLIVVGIT